MDTNKKSSMNIIILFLMTQQPHPQRFKVKKTCIVYFKVVKLQQVPMGDT